MANQNLRAFLIYNKNGKLVSGPILRTKEPKDTRRYYELPLNKCCDTPPLVPMYETPGKLMAFVRYNAAGKAVPFSAIKRRKRPQDGDFVQVPLDLCCIFTTTTTSTSTTSSTTTTTTTVATTTTTSSTTTTTTTV